MKKRPRDFAVGTGAPEAFFERSPTRARKLDRGEALPAEMRLTFEDPAETNPGHGRRKIVEPLASKYELSATI